MAAPTKTVELVDLVRRSGLIDPERLDHVLGSDADDESILPQQVAQRLVAAGLVTQFQAEQFLLGKWRGFTIGKYRVLERLGFGGNGTVYLCEHLLVKRRVAVKVLTTAKADNPAALGRFYREARAAGVLDHPNLVKAHDVDQENGLHFLVMEYVDGASFQDLVARRGPLSVERAAHYIRQAAQGLEAAHQAGLVHRDIKPSNILLDRSGTVRVLDLGLARFFRDETDLLTLKYDDNAVLGTADYVSPEQALNSHGVDIRADIYSLGCTFYFLLMGRPPFPGGKTAQKLIAHQTKEPAPIRDQRRDVPAALAAVVTTMMAKDPAKRYQTPGEFVDALAPFAATPIPPPADVEMPTLSPAARADSDPGPPSPSSSVSVSTRGTPTFQARVATPISGVPALGGAQRKSSSHADAATPRALGADTPTGNDSKSSAHATPATLPSPNSKRTVKKPAADSGRSLRRLGGILIASALIGVLTRWSLLHRETVGNPPPQPALLLVAKGGAYPTITAALAKARPGDRIEVHADEWEESVLIAAGNGTARDVRLEGKSATGKPTLWRAPRGHDESQPLLKVTGTTGLHVNGFTFDGQERVRELIVLQGDCHGVVLDSLHLTGFRHSAVAFRNCSGDSGQPVTLQRLRIVATASTLAGLHFDSRGEETNRHVRVLDSRVEGPSQAAVVLSGRTANIELTRNRLFGCTDGIVYRKAQPAHLIGLQLTSNTFAQIDNAALHFETTPPGEGSRVELTSNVFARTGRLAVIEGFEPEPRQVTARWIAAASSTGPQPRYFRQTFTADGPSVVRAGLDICADAGFIVWLNGERIGQGELEPSRRVYAFDVARHVRPGLNVLAVQVSGSANPALLSRLTYASAGSDSRVLSTDGTWKTSAQLSTGWQQTAFDDSRWQPSRIVAPYGEGDVAWRGLVWDTVVQDTFGGKAAQLFPEPVGNIRDVTSKESFPPLKAEPAIFTLSTNRADDATFLRYPR